MPKCLKQRDRGFYYRQSKWESLISEAQTRGQSLMSFMAGRFPSILAYRAAAKAQTRLRAWQRAGCPPRPPRSDKGKPCPARAAGGLAKAAKRPKKKCDDPW